MVTISDSGELSIDKVVSADIFDDPVNLTFHQFDMGDHTSGTVEDETNINRDMLKSVVVWIIGLLDS